MIDLPDFDADVFIEKACRFIQEKVETSNSNGVVIGLSGGIDSTVVAGLAVKALGANNVKGFVLPSTSTSDEDLFDAELVKTGLDIECDFISIDDFVENFLSSCSNEKLPDEYKEIALMNVKPRMRMTILYYYAAIYNSLVIGTGNKTEIQLGYFTKYGDGGVDLLPIGDLYKQEVKSVARKLNVPESIINKAPTAGLKPNQTDESEIGLSYPIIDRILYLYLEENKSTDEISNLLDIQQNKVERIIKMIKNSQHKRSTAPILNKK
ncbi:MAG: NAD+ synthase [Methanosphaera stadtmanae]|jgi:NAD+ synthase|nr:NAD+ synthase [Methanosphaera stadtmanae]